jgi:hypothetical protein
MRFVTVVKDRAAHLKRSERSVCGVMEEGKLLSLLVFFVLRLHVLLAKATAL